MLLEAAPCSQCQLPFQGEGEESVVCDRCNAPFHLKCIRLSCVPPTYWYCKGCSSHLVARGLSCPTEDILLHRYLLGLGAPPTLLSTYRYLSSTLTFDQGKLFKWIGRKWVHFPPMGQ